MIMLALSVQHYRVNLTGQFLLFCVVVTCTQMYTNVHVHVHDGFLHLYYCCVGCWRVSERVNRKWKEKCYFWGKTILLWTVVCIWNSSCIAVMHMLFHVRTFFLHNFSQLITRISGAESMMLWMYWWPWTSSLKKRRKSSGLGCLLTQHRSVNT